MKALCVIGLSFCCIATAAEPAPKPLACVKSKVLGEYLATAFTDPTEKAQFLERWKELPAWERRVLAGKNRNKPRDMTLAEHRAAVVAQYQQEFWSQVAQPAQMLSGAIDCRMFELQNGKLVARKPRIGDVGQLASQFPLRIVQVRDETSALAEFCNEVFLLDGINTKGMVDDREYLPREVFRIDGTHRYTAVSGGATTVLILKVYRISPPKRLTEWLKREGKVLTPQESEELKTFTQLLDD